MSEHRSVPDPVRQGARRTPRAPALVSPGGRTHTYAALDAAADRAAARLTEAGVAEGDCVACLLPRAPAYVAVLIALWRCGAVAAPLPARTPAAGHAHLLRTVAARFFITTGEADDGSPAHHLAALRLADGLFDEATGEAPANDMPEAAEAWRADRRLTLVFTSGSTGAPKAALHTAGNHFLSAEGSRQNLPLAAGDRWLLSLPLYHVGGLAVVLRCLWAGATVVFPKASERAGPAIRRTGATHVSLVAAQLRRLLGPENDGDGHGQNDGPPASLKAVLLGGGPLPPALLARAYHAGWPLAVSYGLTEMTSQVTTTAPGDALDVLHDTAGRPLPHRRVRIRPDASGKTPGEAVAEGEIGEIMVSGGTRFAGYVGDGGRLREPFTSASGDGTSGGGDGWFATGDLGRFDAAGRLRVTGRRDRQFVSGGENVQPEEIEAALRRLPGVADAAVVPVPDAAFGHRPVAFVRGPEDEPFDAEARAVHLRDALRRTLPGYKVPDAFYPWPRTADGVMKPDRSFLRREARRLAAGSGA